MIIMVILNHLLSFDVNVKFVNKKAAEPNCKSFNTQSLSDKTLLFFDQMNKDPKISDEFF